MQGKGDLMVYRKNLVREYLKSGDATHICADGVRHILWDRALLKAYPQANREKVLSQAEVVFTQELWNENREVLKIQCSKD